jgi:hypothetical protein
MVSILTTDQVKDVQEIVKAMLAPSAGDKKISQLDAIPAMDNADLLAIVDDTDATTKKVTNLQIKNYVLDGLAYTDLADTQTDYSNAYALLRINSDTDGIEESGFLLDNYNLKIPQQSLLIQTLQTDTNTELNISGNGTGFAVLALIESSTDFTRRIQQAGVSKLEFGTTTTKYEINSVGYDVDVVIQGDNDANLFTLDAGTDTICIGGTLTSDKFNVNGSMRATGQVTFNNTLKVDSIVENTGGNGVTIENINITDNTITHAGSAILITKSSAGAGAAKIKGNGASSGQLTLEYGNNANSFVASAQNATTVTETYGSSVTGHYFNFTKATVDFFFRGSSDNNLLTTDAATDTVCIGGAITTAKFNVIGDMLIGDTADLFTTIYSNNPATVLQTNIANTKTTFTVLGNGIGNAEFNITKGDDGNVFYKMETLAAAIHHTVGSSIDDVIFNEDNKDCDFTFESVNVSNLFKIDAGNDQIEIHGGEIHNVTTVNAATYDMQVTDYIMHVTYTATGAVTSLTLPSAQAVSGRFFIVKDGAGNAGTYSITVDTEGSEKIDWADTLVINGDNDSAIIYSDGTNYFVVK